MKIYVHARFYWVTEVDHVTIGQVSNFEQDKTSKKGNIHSNAQVSKMQVQKNCSQSKIVYSK